MTLAITAALIAGCILGKDDKKEPKLNQFTISGLLAELRYEQTSSLDNWTLHIDSLYPERYDLYYCGADGYLGNSDTTDYTNGYMSPSNLVPSYTFSAPIDTTAARNFTHWRLDITCPDSIPVPQ